LQKIDFLSYLYKDKYGPFPVVFIGEIAMLVLSRQRDESIVIGDNIVVTIVDIRGDKVRLGIDAPTEVPVHRREVFEAIQRENLRAAQLDPNNPNNSAKK
jgi:carbon storage regulator